MTSTDLPASRPPTRKPAPPPGPRPDPDADLPAFEPGDLAGPRVVWASPWRALAAPGREARALVLAAPQGHPFAWTLEVSDRGGEPPMPPDHHATGPLPTEAEARDAAARALADLAGRDALSAELDDLLDGIDGGAVPDSGGHPALARAVALADRLGRGSELFDTLCK